MEPVRWGILSTAKIGTEKVIPGMLKEPSLKIVGLASRDAARGAETAKRLGIPKSYGSYEAMLDDPEIEAIYNPLPNHLHVPMTLEAAKRGKHVLCEKPIAITAKEAMALQAVPKGIHVAEAFMVRHNPQWQKARELAKSGVLGTVRGVQVLFSYFNDDPANIRNMADIGGGAILDIGCYPITVSRYVFDAEPKRVVASIERDPKFKTDRLSSGIADFGDGRHLTFTCGTQLANHQRANIIGTKGRYEIDIPFNAPPTSPNVATLFLDGKAPERMEFPVHDQYGLQGRDFSRVVRGLDKPLYGVADAIQNMKIIDAFFRSETSGAFEVP